MFRNPVDVTEQYTHYYDYNGNPIKKPWSRKVKVDQTSESDMFINFLVDDVFWVVFIKESNQFKCKSCGSISCNHVYHTKRYIQNK